MNRPTTMASKHPVGEYSAATLALPSSATSRKAQQVWTSQRLRRGVATGGPSCHHRRQRRAADPWNVLCTFLFTAELIASNRMPMVGRPKLAKTCPRH